MVVRMEEIELFVTNRDVFATRVNRVIFELLVSLGLKFRALTGLLLQCIIASQICGSWHGSSATCCQSVGWMPIQRLPTLPRSEPTIRNDLALGINLLLHKWSLCRPQYCLVAVTLEILTHYVCYCAATAPVTYIRYASASEQILLAVHRFWKSWWPPHRPMVCLSIQLEFYTLH